MSRVPIAHREGKTTRIYTPFWIYITDEHGHQHAEATPLMEAIFAVVHRIYRKKP